MTAPVAPMEARCEHCHDTGSSEKQIDGYQDCAHCDATTRKRALIDIAVKENWGFQFVLKDALWAAYLFAQRQAAPVAQPAQQVEAVGYVPDGWKLVPEEPTAEMYRAAAKIDNEMFAGGSSHGAEDGQVWAAMYDAAPNSPQLEAQQAGDVANELEFLESWLSAIAEPVGANCCGLFSVGAEYMGQQEQVCCDSPEPEFMDIDGLISAMNKRREEIIAAIAQGRKA